MEDMGPVPAGRRKPRGRRADRSQGPGGAGVAARHKGILIERCRDDDIVVAPDGICGNLIFRTLLLLCGAQSYGAPVLMDKIFIDSSRARGSFDGPVMLASAMAGMKEKNRD